MTTTKPRHATAWTAVFFLLLAIAGQASAARVGRLIGKVSDPEGKPIEGVRVTTTCVALPDFREIDTTDGKGIFMVDFRQKDVVYLYEFEKAGYVPLKIEQKWTIDGTERHGFTLQPIPPSTVGDLPPVLAGVADPAIAAFNDGVRAWKARQAETALAKFLEATRHDAELRQAWVALSAVYLDLKRHADAAEAAEKAIALGAGDESLLKTRWEAYRHLGDEAKATAAREALEKFGRLSEEAKRIYNQGVAFSKVDEHAEAFAKFKEALELDPNLEPALLGLATSALALDQAADALAAAETLLKSDPQHAEGLKIRYNAALIVRDEAKLHDALISLATVDAATAAAGLFQLADLAFQRDETAKALERLRRVLAIDAQHARAHYLMGLILMRDGARKAEARQHLQRFLDLAPNDTDADTARGALQYLKASS